MKKRLFTWILCLIILLAVSPMQVFAAETVASGSCGENVTWSLSEDGVLTFSGTGPMKNYSETPWDDYKSSITSVIIENGVTTIGNGVFRSCKNLTSVTIPDSVTIIGEGAFVLCKSLTNVTIPNSVTTIKPLAFQGCSGLTSMTIPDSVTTIGYNAFQLCTNLEGILVSENNQNYCNDEQGALFNKDKSQLLYVPNKLSGDYSVPYSVETIDRYVFFNCDGLTSVTIPDSVTTIDVGTFSGCNGLTSVTIGSGVTFIGQDAFRDCNSLSSVTIPDSVTTIDWYAFYGCSSLEAITFPASVTSIGSVAFKYCRKLSEITFSGNAPTIESDAFSDVIATAYYPAGNATWTASVMGNYGGNITWVPYDPETGDEEETEPPCSLDELTELDYLAFSWISYLDFERDGSVKDLLIDMGYWNKYFDKDRKITYAALCEHIAQWQVKYSLISDKSHKNGFYAVPFENTQGEAVLAYRGSVPLFTLESILNLDDTAYDWLINDIPIQFLNILGPQYKSAIDIYADVEEEWGKSNIVVTGHSLGGAWADVISAFSGCKGVTFNAVSVLDTAYNAEPVTMGRAFSGVDVWNFIDHANKYDGLAGSFEKYWSLNEIKPYIAHNTIYTDFILNTKNHGLQSLVKHQNNTLTLTDVDTISSYKPYYPTSNHLSFHLSSIDLGTSRGDELSSIAGSTWAWKSFGGDGDDIITGDVLSDTLVGGRGYDTLDGGWLDDKYIYYKGDDWDYIYDPAGSDKLYLYDFDKRDVITAEVSEDGDVIDIKCNGDRIVSVYRSNRQYTLIPLYHFEVYVGETLMDITNMFKTVNYKSRVWIACPVSVEVLNTEGNVVYTLKDGEVGNYYTEYGNFYVFEEEDGGYGKVVDLIEGYDIRIVGEDTGTMDVVYQDVVDGELDESEHVADIPVSESFTAAIEKKTDGTLVLAVDNNNDGVTDEETVFASGNDHNYTSVITDPTCTEKGYTTHTCACGNSYVDDYVDALGHDYVGGTCTSCGDTFQNPFTDVKKGDFYYDPVMWAVQNGITKGVDDTHFGPDQICNRGQVVTFLWRAAGKPEPKSSTNPFVDVKTSDYFYKPVLWALENNITKGVDDTHFGPDQICNRSQVVTFLWRAIGRPEPTSNTNPFVDSKETDFFYKPVLWALENSITKGVDTTHFGPDQSCNRGQVVTFLYRTYGK